jgi:MoxR-like ATPase
MCALTAKESANALTMKELTMTAMPLMSEGEIIQLQTRAQALLKGLNAVLLGQKNLTQLVLTGMLAGGHVLLEGLPGLGKTELIKALALLTGLEHKRIQFTPDLLPSDITGTTMLQETSGGGRQLLFRQGPIFAQVVLADEINRASPKTQSALLQAMQEHTVTVFDTTHKLPKPFFVLATQNPVELDGTYPLPEAQLDRFAIKATVTGVATDTLTQLLMQRPDGKPPTPESVTTPQQIIELMDGVRKIAVPEAVAQYVARLVNATRPELTEAPAFVKSAVKWGASPRAAIALSSCARAAALMAGRPAIGFADVKLLAASVIAHRLVMSYEAGLAGTTATAVVEQLIQHIPELSA